MATYLVSVSNPIIKTNVNIFSETIQSILILPTLIRIALNYRSPSYLLLIMNTSAYSQCTDVCLANRWSISWIVNGNYVYLCYNSCEQNRVLLTIIFINLINNSSKGELTFCNHFFLTNMFLFRTYFFMLITYKHNYI